MLWWWGEAGFRSSLRLETCFSCELLRFLGTWYYEVRGSKSLVSQSLRFEGHG
ncbi:MAG: hypothetical protein K0R47_4337 [Brevibacillus sp.]|nr:hypothetical protein [Brevibacillus sp.]